MKSQQTSVRHYRKGKFTAWKVNKLLSDTTERENLQHENSTKKTKQISVKLEAHPSLKVSDALSRVRVSVMVFNATYNSISAISLGLVLLVEKTGVPREHHRPFVSHWQTLSHNVVSSTPHHERD